MHFLLYLVCGAAVACFSPSVSFRPALLSVLPTGSRSLSLSLALTHLSNARRAPFATPHFRTHSPLLRSQTLRWCAAHSGVVCTYNTSANGCVCVRVYEGCVVNVNRLSGLCVCTDRELRTHSSSSCSRSPHPLARPVPFAFLRVLVDVFVMKKNGTYRTRLVLLG